MAANRIKGITIEIGGDTTELQQNLRDVNKSLGDTQSSLRDVNKLLKLDPTNVDLLKQKQDYLKTAIDETRTKLEKEKEALKQLNANNPTDELTEDQKALTREVAETESKLKSLEKQYSQFGTVGGQVLQAQGKELQDLGSKLTDVGKKLTTYITLPIIAAGTAAVKLASDYEENLNKVDVAFGESAAQVKSWAQTATESFGLSESSALEAAALFGDMGTAMGLTTGEAANMATTLTGLAGDLASFKNISTDQAMNALKAVFTGETEALKNLGVVMTQTNLEGFAARQGLVYKEMDETQKVTLRYQYVLDRTKNAQGDYARTSDGTANSLRTMQEELKNLAVSFGELIIPVITPLIQGLTDIIKAIDALPRPVKAFIVVAAAMAAAIGPIILGVGQLITGVGGLMIALGKAGTGMAAIAPVAATMGTALTALTPIILGLAAVLAGLMVGKLIAENWDQICAAAAKAGEAIKEAAQSIGQSFSEMNDNIIASLDSATNAVSEKAGEMAETLRTKLSNIWNDVKSTVSNIAQSMMSVTTTSGYTGYGYNSSLRSGVSWHADAMSEGIIMNNPTIFGMYGGKLQGAGETGAEVLVGANSLRAMVREAAASAASNVSINVYAQPGQDTKALAREIEKVFVMQQRQRGLAGV